VAETTERTIPREVVDYLNLHHIITLSTASFTGMPHADTVVFGNDDRRLFFFGVEGSILARNIRDNRHVSFTVDDYTTDWRKVRELQGVGKCAPAQGQDESAVQSLMLAKMGAGFSRPQGVLYAIVPHEMHFVDYDYSTLGGSAVPEVRDRMFQFEAAPSEPSRGALSTSLDRTTFNPGQVIFRPGDDIGQYFVVVEGEVEIRAEGHGADQTVVRVSQGQMFGDQGTMRGQKGRLTAHAVTRTVLLAVEREAIRDLLMGVGDAE
jgi:Cyclic nucleotide-binding domain/Pyridoxamine 5'-phosphate oxidase